MPWPQDFEVYKCSECSSFFFFNLQTFYCSVEYSLISCKWLLVLGCLWSFCLHSPVMSIKYFYFLIGQIILLFSFRRTPWFQKKLWALLPSWRKLNITQQPASPWPYAITHSTWVVQQDIRNWYIQFWSISIWSMSRKLAGGKVRDFNLLIEREKNKKFVN